MEDTDNTQHTAEDGQRTTLRVWHKLPTGEPTNYYYTYPRTNCVQYLRILLSSFGEEDFQIGYVFGYYFANKVGGTTI